MENLDVLQLKKAEIKNKMNEAMKNDDQEAFFEAWDEFADMLKQSIIGESKGAVQEADSAVLNGRGVRQLTSEENTYYQKVIEAMKSSSPKQALADLDDVLPKTVIDAVFDELVEKHPLLDLINFQNTSGLVEFLVNTQGTELATWGVLTAEITKELTSGFKKVNLELNKLSAFLPVAKSMLDLGPKWLDRYVRAILFEAIANGLEAAIIDGDGNNKPIGMTRQVGDDVVVVGGVYPRKDTVALVSLDPITYGSIVAGMAVGPNGKTRVVNEIVMIVNPIDYLTKIMPATTIRNAEGKYVNNVFPFPTKVIQSTQVPSGKAILGLAKRYFMGVGTKKKGKIEYSDEYKFLEDERVYLIKLYGHGEPLDNTAFVYADISGLIPARHEVFVINDALDPIAIDEIPDASLSAISLGSVSLSPTFNKSTHSYTAATSNATNTITADAMDDEATVAILVNDTAHTNGTPASWTEGENTVVITVTNGVATETYNIVVTYTAA